MARYECERCHTTYHVVDGFIDGTNDTEHLCKDLKKRWERRERQRDAVVKILEDHYPGYYNTEEKQEVAEIIVEKLVNLQINMED